MLVVVVQLLWGSRVMCGERGVRREEEESDEKNAENVSFYFLVGPIITVS